MSEEYYRKLADSRHDRVVVDDVSYARGWLARNELAKGEAGQVAYLEHWTKVNFADLQKELAEARAERDDLGRWANQYKAELLMMTAERDALQAKYDAAVEVAEDLARRFVINPKEAVAKEIAVKLANAADEGKRGKA